MFSLYVLTQTNNSPYSHVMYAVVLILVISYIFDAPSTRGNTNILKQNAYQFYHLE